VATSTDTGTFYITYPASGTPLYEIDYAPEDRSFIIGLFAEPLGNTRQQAVTDLQTRTGLSESELCSSNIAVYVPAWVNDYYRGQNLGIEGCPGAMALPN
jgi:hypothetical protein